MMKTCHYSAKEDSRLFGKVHCIVSNAQYSSFFKEEISTLFYRVPGNVTVWLLLQPTSRDDCLEKQTELINGSAHAILPPFSVFRDLKPWTPEAEDSCEVAQVVSLMDRWITYVSGAVQSVEVNCRESVRTADDSKIRLQNERFSRPGKMMSQYAFLDTRAVMGRRPGSWGGKREQATRGSGIHGSLAWRH